MATQDVDALLNTQPPALPANVARVTADGRPTQHLLNWELFQTDWFRSNIVATDQRIDAVKATADGASAAVSTETNARVSADAALAEQITTVSATANSANGKANQATASGQIYFAAKAAPGGAVAAYGLYLSAGNAFAGMEILADSGGGASIAFSATDFKLTDSGTAQNVFNYTGGVFTFNVPVQVQTIDIAQEAVTKPRTVAITSASTVGNTSGGWVNIITHGVTADNGAYPALVIADFVYRVVTGSGTSSGNWRLVKDRGGALTVLRSGDLTVFTNWFPVLTARLVTDVRDNDTFRLQVRVGGDSTAAFEFDDKAILVDLRKR
jgi:hypothetical protein